MRGWLLFGAMLVTVAGGAARAETWPAFGVVADIQYGDKEGSVSRDYRGSLQRLERCVETFNGQKLDFVVQLGDAVDGYATNAAASLADLDKVLPLLRRLKAPVYHVVGNHCLNAGTNALAQRLGLDRFYYTFTAPAAKGWRFVVLDGNDAGYGVMSESQLKWFQETLGQSQRAGERVICFCHFPLLKTAAEHHRMAKPEEVLKLLDAHTCVAAWIAGHEHAGGYARQRHVHHLTMRGLVEAPGSTAFARMELAGDRILETGYGNEPGREMFLGGASAPPTRRLSFENARIWPDDKSVHINAHGGGILFRDGVYYWYGEHKIAGKAGNVAHVGVHVYSSRDLTNWKDEGIALAVSDDPASEITRECVLERPKVIFNAKTGKYVMWFHLELKGRGYDAARSGVAVADRPTGPFTYLRSVRPDAGVWPVNVTDAQKAALATAGQLKGRAFSGGPNEETPKHCLLARDFEGGQMARDMTLFVDDDGQAYHIFASEENSTLHISLLSDDYLSHAGKTLRLFEHRWHEAPALCKRGGNYYLLTSGCTGWAPNAARSAVAPSIWGPWTERGNPCSGVNPLNRLGPEKTFGGQSTFILPVAGKRDAFIAMFDIWKPDNAIDGRYVWLPMRFTDQGFTVEWRNTWDLGVFEQAEAQR
jgi:hypothetical protein